MSNYGNNINPGRNDSIGNVRWIKLGENRRMCRVAHPSRKDTYEKIKKQIIKLLKKMKWSLCYKAVKSFKSNLKRLMNHEI